MLTLFASAFLLGLLFNAAPGAVFAETVRQGVRGGYRAALAVQLGSLAGDASWAALGLLGVGLLLQSESLRLPVAIAGAVYLLWLAWEAWRAARVPPHRPPQIEAARSDALRAGVLLSLTNPQNLAYWAALGSALGTVGVREPSAADQAVFFAGFMTSSLVWAFVCAALVARALRDVTDCWARLTYRACALAFVLLALSALREQWPAADPRDKAQPAAEQRVWG
ncbi:MAG: LysE family translocator [Burkholderiaceae bacterium]|nr:LysE family translocator [Burkholderiaceae bacterium]